MKPMPEAQSVRRKQYLVLYIAGLVLASLVLSLSWQSSQAAPLLVITPITWDVIGLDSQNINAGPNTYLVGSRVCNQGDAAAHQATVSFVWDSTNPYVALSGPAVQTVPVISANSCADVYFNVTIVRNPAAFLSTRRYHLTAGTSQVPPVSSSGIHELLVQRLNSRAGNGSQRITGPSILRVGQVATYVLEYARSTSTYSTNGFAQLAQTVNFPSSLFRVLAVSTIFASPQGSSGNTIYADACGWDSDPTSSTYLSCTGSGQYQGGKVGDILTTSYTVEAIAPGAFTLQAGVYDFADGGYHYQEDYGSGFLGILTLDEPNQTETPTETPTATQVVSQTVTATATASLSPTVTGTPSTATATPTVTGTPPTATSTATPTVTGTPPTATSTATPTNTGTPPTPTPTGTITPAPTLTNSVNRSEARVNQNFVFTVLIENVGNATATSATLTDVFVTYVDITSVTTTKGTASTNATTRTVTVSIGSIAPNEDVTVVVTARVNSSATATYNLSNTATMTYAYGGSTYSRSSNTISYRIVGGSVLPGTGGRPASPEAKAERPDGWLSLLLAVLGAFAIGIGIWFKSLGSMRKLYIGIGVWLLLVSLVMSPMVADWLRPQGPVSQVPRFVEQPTAVTEHAILPIAPPEAWLATPETVQSLPDYPIPTPQVDAASDAGAPPPDTSPVVRVVIPSLNVDTVVKYVPYDGITWIIAGLQDEVAWMGETSWPGLGSNTVLAGHVTLRTGTDGPFRYLEDLTPGLVVKVYTEQNIYTYRVREQQVVEEDNLSITMPSEKAQLTLITCADWDTVLKYYMHRRIVIADLEAVLPVVQTSYLTR